MTFHIRILIFLKHHPNNVSMDKYQDIANIIASVSDLPSFFIENGEISVIRTGFLSTATMKYIFKFFFKKKPGDKSKQKLSRKPKLLHVINPIGMSFLNLVLCPEPLKNMVFGPFFLEDKDTYTLIRNLCEISEGRFSEEDARDLIDSIPVKDSSFIQSWGQVISKFMGLPQGSYIKINTISESPNSREENFNISENRLTEAEITAHYRYEQELMQLVRQGDREKLRKLLLPKNTDTAHLAMRNSTFESRISKSNSIRTEKNFLITLNVLFRQAAGDAGLPPVYIHSISESIVSSIESSTDRSQLMDVIQTMIDAYCNSLNNMSLQNHSVNVVKVQRYILKNKNQKITLEDLCNLTGLDEAYLCRLFKRECHMTINEYIQEQRITEAKYLLESTKMPIVEISHTLGYSSQSYFCSVFRKLVGVSPSNYRMNNGRFYKFK